MKQVILALAIFAIISAGYSLTMAAPAQGASCGAEYDLCRRVRADPVRTKPNPASRLVATAAEERLKR